MAWPLTAVIVAGTLPGVFLGYYFRVKYLPDPGVFRLFVGCVLLYIAIHLLYGTLKGLRGKKNRIGTAGNNLPESAVQWRAPGGKSSKNSPGSMSVRTVAFTFRKIEYAFDGETFSIRTPGIFCMALVVGVVGGAYGIGGGSILAPFCVAVYGLPVYTVAGAALMGTFITSIAGVIFYSAIPSQSGLSTSPDWLLGILFGLGGIAGMYCGARLQRFVPQAYIKLILVCIMLFIASRYIAVFFRS